MIERCLPDHTILRIEQEALNGGEALTDARELIQKEMSRRGILLAGIDATGLYDASQDDCHNPDHVDQYWKSIN